MEERQFQCQSCPKSYTRQFSLKNHYRVHTGSKPFPCRHSPCTKTFVSHDHRGTHELTHTKDKRHVCNTCGKAFLRSCTLRRHERGANQRCRPGRVQIASGGTFQHRNDSTPEISSAQLPFTNHYQDVGMDQHNTMIPLFPAENAPAWGSTPSDHTNVTIYKEPSAYDTRSAIRGGLSWSTLLSHGPYFSSWYEKAWFIAAEEGNADALHYLCSVAKVNVETQDGSDEKKTALRIVSVRGHHEALKILLDLGANFNPSGPPDKSPLYYAIAQNRKECALTLIEHGSDVDAVDGRGRAIAMYAVFADCDLDVFAALLNKMEDIDHTDKFGQSLIHIAAMQKNSAYLSSLLAHGADITKRDENGRTALHFACLYGVKDSILLILGKDGSLIDARDNDKQTALHSLGKWNFFKTTAQFDQRLQLMQTRGADLNARDKNGNTPLMLMLKSYSSAYAPDDLSRYVVSFLNHGADLNIINQMGQTALDMALDNLAPQCTDIIDKVRSTYNMEDRVNILEALKIQFDIVQLLIKRNAKTADQLHNPNSHTVGSDESTDDGQIDD